MTDCNATLTTAVTAECPAPVGNYRKPCKSKGVVCNTMGHVTMHTIKCDSKDGFPRHAHGSDENNVVWNDDTPGATPHKPPLVSDEEVEAARSAFSKNYASSEEDLVRAVLEAAAKVRQDNG